MPYMSRLVISVSWRDGKDKLNENARNKNYSTEMKNAFDGFLIRFNVAEDRMRELEHSSVKIAPTENKEK